jgi:hypothetical protein
LLAHATLSLPLHRSEREGEEERGRKRKREKKIGSKREREF